MLYARRLRIVIPTTTSVIRFEPKYFVPLLEAKYRPAIPDGSLRTEVSEIPNAVRTPSNVWREFSSVDEEVRRVRTEFSSVTDTYGRPVTDVVYPGDALERAVRAEAEAAAERLEAAQEAADISGDVASLKAKGITDDHRRALVAAGYVSLDVIAAADPEALAALPGIGLKLAKAIHAGALKGRKVEIPTSANAGAGMVETAKVRDNVRLSDGPVVLNAGSLG